MRLLIAENIYYTNLDVFPHRLLSVAYWTVSIIVSSEFQDTSSRKSCHHSNYQQTLHIILYISWELQGEVSLKSVVQEREAEQNNTNLFHFFKNTQVQFIIPFH